MIVFYYISVTCAINTASSAAPLISLYQRMMRLNLVLEFLNNLWGLGRRVELGCRTGPPGYTAWKNSLESVLDLLKSLKIRLRNVATAALAVTDAVSTQLDLIHKFG